MGSGVKHLEAVAIVPQAAQPVAKTMFGIAIPKTSAQLWGQTGVLPGQAMAIARHIPAQHAVQQIWLPAAQKTHVKQTRETGALTPVAIPVACIVPARYAIRHSFGTVFQALNVKRQGENGNQTLMALPVVDTACQAV